MKGKGCFVCGGGHLARNCPKGGKGGKGKGKGKGKGGKGPQCWTCGERHVARDCPRGRAAGSRDQPGQPESVPDPFRELLQSIREGNAVEVEFDDLGPTQANELALALEGNRSVTKVSFFTQLGLVALAAALGRTSITRLYISHFIEADAKRILAEGLRQSSVTDLSISSVEFGDEGLQALALVLKETSLTRLRLWETDCGAVGIRALAQGLKQSSVTDLQVSDMAVHDDGLLALVEALKETSLTRLAIVRGGFGVVGMRALAQGLRQSSVTALNTSFNNFGDEGLQALADVLKETSLVILHVGGTGITPKGLEALASGLQGVPFSKLLLSPNELGLKGAEILAQLLKSSQISHLSIEECGFGAAGAQVLAKVLRQSRLTFLDLLKNPIDPEGLRALAHGLQFSQVQHLKLPTETAACTQALASVLKRSLLTRLIVTCNPEVDLASFAEAAKGSGLTELRLVRGESGPAPPLPAALEAVLQANKSSNFTSERLVLQMRVQGHELSFRTMGGNMAAVLVWDFSHDTMDLPEAVFQALDPQVLPAGVQLRAPNLRFLRPDGALLDYDATLAEQL